MPDLRKKLDETDPQKIRFLLYSNYTIREVSREFNISTKYTKRLMGVLDGPVENIIPTYSCSGCGFSFTYSGLLVHQEIWTSGNLPLSCIAIAP